MVVFTVLQPPSQRLLRSLLDPSDDISPYHVKAIMLLPVPAFLWTKWPYGCKGIQKYAEGGAEELERDVERIRQHGLFLSP